MRLTAKERLCIKKAFAACLPAEGYKIYLYGSRVDDTKKGGDIDLLIVSQPNLKDEIIDSKARIRGKIFEVLPEQKIDLTVATESDLTIDPFLKSLQIEEL